MHRLSREMGIVVNEERLNTKWWHSGAKLKMTPHKGMTWISLTNAYFEGVWGFSLNFLFLIITWLVELDLEYLKGRKLILKSSDMIPSVIRIIIFYSYFGLFPKHTVCARFVCLLQSRTMTLIRL